jgi:hypothetical protein
MARGTSGSTKMCTGPEGLMTCASHIQITEYMPLRVPSMATSETLLETRFASLGGAGKPEEETCRLTPPVSPHLGWDSCILKKMTSESIWAQGLGSLNSGHTTFWKGYHCFLF